MTKWWKPAGPGAFEFGIWRVQKNWQDSRWSIYRDGNPCEGDYDDALSALKAADKGAGE